MLSSMEQTTDLEKIQGTVLPLIFVMTPSLASRGPNVGPRS